MFGTPGSLTLLHALCRDQIWLFLTDVNLALINGRGGKKSCRAEKSGRLLSPSKTGLILLVLLSPTTTTLVHIATPPSPPQPKITTNPEPQTLTTRALSGMGLHISWRFVSGQAVCWKSEHQEKLHGLDYTSQTLVLGYTSKPYTGFPSGCCMNSRLRRSFEGQLSKPVFCSLKPRSKLRLETTSSIHTHSDVEAALLKRLSLVSPGEILSPL